MTISVRTLARWTVNVLGAALVVTLVLGSHYDITYMMKRAKQAKKDSFRPQQWADSEILRHLGKHTISGCVHSNAQAAIHFYFHEFERCTQLPYKFRFFPDLIEEWDASAGDIYLIWFFDYFQTRSPYFGYSLHDIQELIDLTTVMVAPEGILLKVGGSEPLEKISANADDASEPVVAGKRIVSSDFNVYFNEIHNGLIYTKNSCNRSDMDTHFFLHVTPVDRNELPEDRKQHGFDNRDFKFNRNYGYGARVGDRCVFGIPLPEYDITHIRTGQYVPGKSETWQGDFHFGG